MDDHQMEIDLSHISLLPSNGCLYFCSLDLVTPSIQRAGINSTGWNSLIFHSEIKYSFKTILSRLRSTLFFDLVCFRCHLAQNALGKPCTELTGPMSWKILWKPVGIFRLVTPIYHSGIRRTDASAVLPLIIQMEIKWRAREGKVI